MSTTYWFDSTPFTTYGEFNPVPLNSRSDLGHTVKQLQASQSIRFASNSASVVMYSYFSTAAARTYVLLQNGSQVGSVNLPATGGGAYDFYTLATGLDTGEIYEYEVLCITPILGGIGNWFDAAVVLDDASLSPIVHPKRLVFAFYGDSITGLSNAHQTDINSGLITDTRYSDMWIACQANNRALSIAAFAGGAVVNTGRDNTGSIPAACDQLHIRYGTNDLIDLPSGNATFQQAYSDMVDNARTQIGAGKQIHCYQPIPRATGGSQRANCGDLIQAAILGKSEVFYHNTDNWVPTDTGNMPDGLHPNAAGYALYATNEVPLWAPQAFAGTPSSGVYFTGQF